MANQPEMRLHLKCFHCLMESDLETTDIAVRLQVAPCETHGFHAAIDLAVFCPHCEEENVSIVADQPLED